MASKWRMATIEDVAEKVGMGPFGSSIKVETFVTDGVPIIGSKHLHKFKMDDAQPFKFITPDHAQRLANSNVAPGDIILTHRGSIGQVSYIPQDSQYSRYMISQSQFYMRCDRTKVIPEYVTMYFKSPEGQHQLLANTSQVGVPAIAQPVTYLRTIVIPLPPLEEQRRIAHILGSLDDKIELDRRMNTTLEEMSRALFKSWFVDFEPVRAKMEGRWRRGESLPGMSAELYHLFPKRLVLSKLGEVPEGWKVGTIDDIARSPRRNVSPSNVKASTPYIGLQRMPRRSIALTEWSTSDEVTSTKATFKKGEILFGKLRPYFHKVGIAPLDGLCSTDIVVLTPTTDNWSAFLLCCVSTDEFVGYTDQTSTGTRMPRTSWKAMKQFETCLPPNALASAFQRITEPMLKRIVMNCHESQSLAKMRDALLPGLVSENVTII